MTSRFLRTLRCFIAALTLVSGTPFAADAPSQVAIATKAGPTDPLSLTIEPTAIPKSNSSEPRPVPLLGKSVAPGAIDVLYWSPGVSFDGNSIPRGVLVANGQHSGPTLCLTAVLHGDEHNGLEIVRRVLYEIDPSHLSGAVIGVPIVNLDGFRRGTRYLPDRRDLNRYFPGKEQGSAAARLAHSLFEDVIKSCNYLVDIHTGSFHRANLTQVRGDLTNLDVVDLSRRFGSTVILHNRGAVGTLRRAATDAGIPTVTLETGEPLRIQEREVRHGVAAIQHAMSALSMYPRTLQSKATAPVYFESRWVRVNEGGVLMSGVRLGELVAQGARLGTVTDPVTNHVTNVVAPYPGRVLGLALDQVVLPGYAAFHIGITSTIEEAKAAEPTDALDADSDAPDTPEHDPLESSD
ncbi:MAG TPA: succinylglutamate desuccinylase/aspartoacylase family protein [Pseudomonadales bacterium]|nr:succinylglutamate desuccinylase/aspartoacylase family protein [Pseudomonadales bacterium]